jgi:hypothetical protein
MIPNQTRYPDFVPDQLLTSANLNDLFAYLDEQGRMTRTNLLGIGIVYGLEVRTSADGTSIEITRGTGVTSEGHLVAFDGDTATRTFGHRVAFDPEKEAYYDKFLDASHHEKFELWELKRTAAGEGEIALTKSFLEGEGVPNHRKVVLAFVELLEEQNKNCNPESCDDKGVTVHVNLRFLLANRGDLEANGLKPQEGPHHSNAAWAALPRLRMRRFDVEATTMTSAAGLLTGYRRILTPTFLTSVETALSQVWTEFRDLLGIEFQSANPFANVAESLAFVHDGSIDATRLRGMQYAYDHVSDLLAAYEELRATGMEVLGKCCPDPSLFPRHLVLDLAVPTDLAVPSEFRHRFQRSPLFEERDLVLRLRSLFRRLALMAGGFHVPDLPGTPTNPDGTIRITPSRLDPSPLSDKAIPFHYRPSLPTARPLYLDWSFGKTQAQASRTNLSWHAGDWAVDDFARNPLLYDLEPYDFLRIEGHVGKRFSQAIGDLKAKVERFRLPIDVVGVVLGSDASDTAIADPRALRAIQIQYELLRAEVLCCLRRQAEYWGKLKIREELGYGRIAKESDRPERMFVVRMARMAPDRVVEDDATPAAPAPTPGASGGGAGGSPSGSGTMVHEIAAGKSRKGDAMMAILAETENGRLMAEYLGYQEAGEVDLGPLPDPDDRFDAGVVSHHALKILDGIAALLVALEAEDPLSLDIGNLTRRSEALEKAIAKFLQVVDAELGTRRPFQKIRAHVGQTQGRVVDAIERAVPDLTEAEADAVVLLLLNLPESEKTEFVRDLRAAADRTAQRAVLRMYYGRLDKDGMMVPPAKDIPATGDPFLLALREKLRGFGCLCALAGFAKLRQLLRDHLEDLRRSNLFPVFAQAHPGLQHKAGVPLGGTFVVVYLRKGTAASAAAATDAADARYRTVAESFPDGMVVADFYLPYRIASNLPPIVFQVVEAEPAPEVVTLALQPNPAVAALRYSVGDATPYAFTHSPNQGALTNGTPANGVTTQGADNFVFTPSGARALVGDQAMVGIEFTYVKRGVFSDPVRVEIFNLPTATIASASTSGAAATFLPGTRVSVRATTRFADGFRWVLQDSAGRSEDVGTSADVLDLVLEREGEFTLTLFATQGATRTQAVSNGLRFTVKDDLDKPVKVCGDLAAIVEAWKSLGGQDADAHKALLETVLGPLGLVEYFAALEQVAGKGEKARIEFFAARTPRGDGFADLLETWTLRIAEILRKEKAGARRRMLLETYRLLVELLLYVSCLRSEDLSGDEAKLFSDLVAQLKGSGRTTGIARIKDLADEEKEVLARLRREVAEEVERNEENNKLVPKPLYARALKALAAAI